MLIAEEAELIFVLQVLFVEHALYTLTPVMEIFDLRLRLTDRKLVYIENKFVHCAVIIRARKTPQGRHL